MVGGMNLNPTVGIAPTTSGKGKVSQQEVSKRIVSIDRMLQVVVEKMSSFEDGQKAFSKLFIKKMTEQTQAIHQIAAASNKYAAEEAKRTKESEEADYDKLEAKTDASASPDKNKGEKKSSSLSPSSMVDKGKGMANILIFAIPIIAAVVNTIVKKFETIKKFWQEKVITPLLDFIDDVSKGFSDTFDSVVGWFKELPTKIVDGLKNIGKDIEENIVNPLQDKFNSFIDGIVNYIVSEYPKLADIFGLKSRNTVVEGQGRRAYDSSSDKDQSKMAAAAHDIQQLNSEGKETSSGKKFTLQDNANFGKEMESSLGKENYFTKIARRESGMGTDIVSKGGGARGIMQIMPDTFVNTAAAHGHKDWTADDRYDPKKNLQVAQWLDEDNRKAIAKKMNKSVDQVSDKEARLGYVVGMGEKGNKVFDKLKEGGGSFGDLKATDVFSEKDLKDNGWDATKSAQEIWDKHIAEGFSNKNTVASSKTELANLTKESPEKAAVATAAVPPGVAPMPTEQQTAAVPPQTATSEKLEDAATKGRTPAQQTQPQVVVAQAGGGGSQSSNSSTVVNNYNNNSSANQRTQADINKSVALSTPV